MDEKKGDYCPEFLTSDGYETTTIGDLLEYANTNPVKSNIATLLFWHFNPTDGPQGDDNEEDRPQAKTSRKRATRQTSMEGETSVRPTKKPNKASKPISLRNSEVKQEVKQEPKKEPPPVKAEKLSVHQDTDVSDAVQHNTDISEEDPFAEDTASEGEPVAGEEPVAEKLQARKASYEKKELPYRKTRKQEWPIRP
ncbi:hypothetical protein H9Q69_005693 [Fusarium xylarioides]|nr:hypothetical protein H9Q69_005693 [Fusarium xylarioides]